MKKTELRGKGYANLLRVSTLDQDLSLDDQRKVNAVFADEYGLRHVLDQEAEGVSGSQTFNRSDLDELIRKKRDGAAFDVVLVHDLSRLTRGGVSHGHEVKQRLARAGLELVSVQDQLPEGDEKELLESVVHYKNKLYSKNLSDTTTRPKYDDLLAGRYPTSSTTPYGFDRLYLSANNQPTLLMRSIGGGVKLKLDPNTLDERGRIVKDEKGRSVKHYKQKDETSRLVPGTTERVEIVRWMFREHYLNNIGIPRITLSLNLRGIVPPAANSWSYRTVHLILRNPVYLGKPVACRISKGAFNKIAKDKPSPVVVDQAKLEDEGYESIPPTKRPKGEWLTPTPDEPLTSLIDDPEVFRLAERAIDDYWQRWEDGSTDEADRDKHKMSEYFLKHLLRSKQGNLAMAGRTTTRQRDKVRYRYYRVRQVEQHEPPHSVMRRQIPAGPLEKAILATVQEVLGSAEHLAPLIDRHIEDEMSGAVRDGGRHAELDAEEAKLSKRINFIYKTADPSDEDDDDLQATISMLKKRRREVQAELTMLKQLDDGGPLEPKAIRQSVLNQCQRLSDHIPELSVAHLQRLVSMLCHDVKVDLETRELTFGVRLPSWAMSKAESITNHVGLASRQAQPPSYGTHTQLPLKIAEFRCVHHRESMKQPICYRCSRSDRHSSHPQRALKAA